MRSTLPGLVPDVMARLRLSSISFLVCAGSRARCICSALSTNPATVPRPVPPGCLLVATS